MSYSNYPTQTEYVENNQICVYCGNSELVIDDSFDEYNNYQGTINYCTCEQAQIEQQMKREMEYLKNKKEEIKNKYKDKLSIDQVSLSKTKTMYELGSIINKYLINGYLNKMTKEEFLSVCESVYDNEKSINDAYWAQGCSNEEEDLHEE